MKLKIECFWHSFVACAMLTVFTHGGLATGVINYWPNPNSYIFDGSRNYQGLLISGSTLYGVTQTSVFSLNTAPGSVRQTLHTFGTGYDGAIPTGHLILSGNWLYGTTKSGGEYGAGTVFGIRLGDHTAKMCKRHSQPPAPYPWIVNNILLTVMEIGV